MSKIMSKITLKEPLWMVLTKAGFAITFFVFAILAFVGALTPIAQIILGVLSLLLCVALIGSIFIKKTSR